jgi:hypothetical protein
MNILLRAVLIIIGLVIGGGLGFVLGIGVAVGLGYLSQWQTPDDPSAFSVAIVVIATAPAGGIIGAWLGAMGMSSILPPPTAISPQHLADDQADN